MPRNSLRMKRIRWLKSTLVKRIKFRFLRELFETPDEQQDDLDQAVVATLRTAEAKRYHSDRNKYRKPRLFLFEEDMMEEGDCKVPAWLNDSEFLQKYRMSRESFNAVHDLIKDHPVFAVSPKGRKQASVKYQLLVFLKFVGTEGNGASNPNLRNVFGIGEGTAELYRQRVVEALLSLQDKVITWPDAKERTEIAARFNAFFKFPNLVGIMDGTLFPLAFRPQTNDAPDYSGRKHPYSISALIVCDDKRRIRYINAGWPGTAHDNRIFKNSKIYQQATLFFSSWEYLLGDSAFENMWFCVSAFRKPRNNKLPRDEELFNDAMKTPRVISEHCIGILKGRFPFLRSIRFLITENKDDLKKILKYILAAAVLHNLLVSYEDEVPEDWIDRDDFSDFDDPDRAMDELNQPIAGNAPVDERRQQLLHYQLQHHVM